MTSYWFRADHGVAVALVALLSACATLPRPAVLDQTLTASTSNEMSSVKEHAPQAFARAEQLRLRAEEAHRDGEVPLAKALAENALVAFERAVLQARAIHVRSELARVRLAAKQRTTAIAQLTALQKQAGEETKHLELRLEIEQHALPRVAIEPDTNARRSAARIDAAKSILEAAHLLCVAARLVAPEQAKVRAELTRVETLAKSSNQLAAHEALTQAMDARVACLRVLTDARAQDSTRSASDAADVLLSKLSPALSDLRPHRDDRGIVLSTYDVWNPEGEVTPHGQDVLSRVLTVAQSNGLPLLVVVHNNDGKRTPTLDQKTVQESLHARGAKATVHFVHDLESLLVDSPAAMRRYRTEFILITR